MFWPISVFADSVIRIDGSSTVFPITEAIAEEYRTIAPQARVIVGISGTGGGVKKFLAGECDIVNASRPFSSSEILQAKELRREYIELPIAYDAITVVVHPQNTWAQSITTAELKRIWEPSAQGVVTRWSMVREGWPDRPLKLYGAGVDSGTYDYFSEAIVGRARATRGDFTSSEDDNVLVQGIARDPDSLGFLGMSYVAENRSRLKTLAIEDTNTSPSKGAQFPSFEGVTAGTYVPLSRPLFIYVSQQALERPEVHAFIAFYLQSLKTIVTEVGYVPLAEKLLEAIQRRFSEKVYGSVYASSERRTQVSLESLFKTSPPDGAP